MNTKQSKFKKILFLILPFLIYSVYRFFVSALIEDYSFMKWVLLAITTGYLSVIIVQTAVKNKMYFSFGFFISFLGLTILTFTMGQDKYVSLLSGKGIISIFLKQPESLIYLSLLIISLFPPLLKIKPFTNYFAKDMVPEAFHTTRLYKVINLFLNYFWVVLFTISFLVQFSNILAVRIIVPIVCQFIIGIPSVKYGVPYLQKKLAYLEKNSDKSYLTSAYMAITGMPMVFDEQKARGKSLKVQFDIYGNENFKVNMIINNGKCEVLEGEIPNADFTFKSPADVFLSVAKGEVSGAEAFLKGMYEIKGDLNALGTFQDIFMSSSNGSAKASTKVSSDNQSSELSLLNKKFFKANPGQIKKVVAIQASPRAPKGSMTEIILDEFLKGCKSQGADTETMYLNKYDIKNCMGCFSCWTKTPGKCVINDDVMEIAKKVRDADLVVYASPLYHFGMYSKLKTYMERTLFTLEPYLVEMEGGTTHPHRKEWKRKNNFVAVIGVCGFPEVKHFDQFSAHFHMVSASHMPEGAKIIAEIYRPASEALKIFMFKKETERVLKETFDAGVQIIKNGFVKKQTLANISRIKMDTDEFRENANMFWDLCIKKGTLPASAFK